jgi:hypothetical protein
MDEQGRGGQAFVMHAVTRVSGAFVGVLAGRIGGATPTNMHGVFTSVHQLVTLRASLRGLFRKCRRATRQLASTPQGFAS